MFFETQPPFFEKFIFLSQAQSKESKSCDPPIEGQVPYKSDLDLFGHTNKARPDERIQQWIKNNEENKERHYKNLHKNKKIENINNEKLHDHFFRDEITNRPLLNFFYLA